MKVKCIENKVLLLPDEIKKNYSISYPEFSVLVGKEYVVYGMTLNLGYIWYYLCDEHFDYYPVWKPSSFFEVVDSRLSRYWIYSYQVHPDIETYPVIAFPEWANNLDYYDKLTDGDDPEVAIFKTYKELMDLEFPDSSISKAAQIGDAEWLICPLCWEPWQNSEDIDALVRCPKCQKILNNPRYLNEWPHRSNL